MLRNYGKARRRKSKPEPESEDDAEYEVEKVISHRRTAEDAPIEYYVSWVGYPGELTWIHEESAAGCPDLVNAYWAKVPAKEQHERFPPGSEEEAEALEANEASSKAVNKKRRASKVTEDDEEEQEEEQEAPKSRRKSAASTKSNGSSKAKKASPPPPKKEKKAKKEPVAKKAKKETKPAPKQEEEEEEEAEVEQEAEEEVVDDHTYSEHDQKYADKEHNWDELVLKVDTVDNEPEGNTGLRFLLKWKEDDSVTYVPNAIARERCPQRIIDFFTEHLKFRQTGDGDEEEEQ